MGGGSGYLRNSEKWIEFDPGGKRNKGRAALEGALPQERTGTRSNFGQPSSSGKEASAKLKKRVREKST